MEAKRHMQDGIACLQNREWEAALHHFEIAADLREATPWREDGESAWLLAAAWINRSDALRALGRTDEAIMALDRGIDAMSCVPWRGQPVYAERLVLAWSNRGTACGEAKRMDESLAGFEKSHEVLHASGGASNPRRKLLGSMLHMNRARVLLDLGRIHEGWTDARVALEFLDELEPDPCLAEAAIKARAILCRAMAMLLDEPDGTKVEADWIAVATDRIEEALVIARRSGYRGSCVADLVRFGARIYRVCQPHFLAQFLCEWLAAGGSLAGDPVLTADMVAELERAKTDLSVRILPRLHETEFMDQARSLLASFQHAESALAALEE